MDLVTLGFHGGKPMTLNKNLQRSVTLNAVLPQAPTTKILGRELC